MEIFLVLFIVVFLAMAINAQEEKYKGLKAKLLENAKFCPPHEWNYEEIKDHEGVTHAWKMVCKRCGPLKPIDGRRSDDEAV